jgi:hypothetical protein
VDPKSHDREGVEHGGEAPAVSFGNANYFAWWVLQQLPLQQGPFGQQFFAAAKLAPTVITASAAILNTTFVILFITILLSSFFSLMKWGTTALLRAGERDCGGRDRCPGGQRMVG